jgi:hypothetical protein
VGSVPALERRVQGAARRRGEAPAVRHFQEEGGRALCPRLQQIGQCELHIRLGLNIFGDMTTEEIHEMSSNPYLSQVQEDQQEARAKASSATLHGLILLTGVFRFPFHPIYLCFSLVVQS